MERRRKERQENEWSPSFIVQSSWEGGVSRRFNSSLVRQAELQMWIFLQKTGVGGKKRVRGEQMSHSLTSIVAFAWLEVVPTFFSFEKRKKVCPFERHENRSEIKKGALPRKGFHCRKKKDLSDPAKSSELKALTSLKGPPPHPWPECGIIWAPWYRPRPRSPCTKASWRWHYTFKREDVNIVPLCHILFCFFFLLTDPKLLMFFHQHALFITLGWSSSKRNE